MAKHCAVPAGMAEWIIRRLGDCDVALIRPAHYAAFRDAAQKLGVRLSFHQTRRDGMAYFQMQLRTGVIRARLSALNELDAYRVPPLSSGPSSLRKAFRSEYSTRPQFDPDLPHPLYPPTAPTHGYKKRRRRNTASLSKPKSD